MNLSAVRNSKKKRYKVSECRDVACTVSTTSGRKDVSWHVWNIHNPGR
jgi:hypothetical protein